MNSEIRIISPKTKIIITLGIGMTITLIVSMFLFPMAWQIGLYITASSVGIYGLGSGLFWIATMYHRLKMMQIERNQSRYITIAHTNNMLDAYTGQVVIRATRLTNEAVIEGSYQEVIQPTKSALSLIDDGYHFLLVGDTGSGKSTLAAHLINQMGISNTVVCDPHATRNEWPSGVKIVQSYESIATVLCGAVKEMRRRYASNQNDKLILLAIDELPTIIDTLSEQGYDIGAWIRYLSREGRKVNIRLLIMSQGENVGDLGQKGYSSVKLNFIKILMSKADTLRNVAKVVYSNGNSESVSLHGPLSLNGGNKVLSLPALQKQVTICPICDSPTDGTMYCSNACKQKAYRQRN